MPGRNRVCPAGSRLLLVSDVKWDKRSLHICLCLRDIAGGHRRTQKELATLVESWGQGQGQFSVGLLILLKLCNMLDNIQHAYIIFKTEF